tara:strand:- start:3052 stop:4062 length:1011 start_codon:yes stop_codon:yes gene_type:complete
MKVTLGTAKTRVAKHLNLCDTDSRVTGYINEAQRRLIESGKWKGTYGKFTLCATDGCIAWPRQIETIESVAVCENPGIVRNGWFEFVESGYGLLDNKDNVGYQLLDRGESPTHKGMSGDGKKVRVYAFLDADAGKTVTIQGRDSNNNWVRTVKSGSGADAVYQDGEVVTLVNGYVDTTTVFNNITGVLKDVTQGNVQLYELKDEAAPTLVDIATYEPDETLPSYRLSIIPSLGGAAGCEDGTDKKVPVTVIAKLRFIDAVNDTDVLMVSDLYSIKNMAIAIKLEENRDFGAAAEYRNLAIESLQNQLANHMGDGVVPVLQMTNLNTHGGGGIESLI